MMLLEHLHGGFIHARRARVLRDLLADLLPLDAVVLDVGSGDGLLAHLVMQERPDLEIKGIDVLIRSPTHIPVEQFDGQVIPHRDASFDVVTFVDVLHHVEDPTVLLREAARVARKAIVIKDHTHQGFLAGATLRFMDWVGNDRHGVALPYNYWTREQWRRTFEDLGLRIDVWKSALGLYPPLADWVFGRSLHFIARLDRG